ncbi:hypothetical protein [Janthinobacterium sp. ROICE36]|uniref:hypothetical protein n=1 Tax=Janthinobacterium sp. ROICE36 TaxID=2048670 RepID=UPI0011AEF1A2|nr:hypothetical protein [Janthinobacterium sp. ROICE36]
MSYIYYLNTESIHGWLNSILAPMADTFHISPHWTTSGAWSLGRDPLGMQATSVRMYRQLVPGLTNVTNRLRYYSFYCWVVNGWAVIRHADNLHEWRLFIRKAEALFALACEAYSPNTGGLAGSDWARLQLIDLADEKFDLRPHTNKPGENNQYLMAKGGNFGQFYVRSMQDADFLAPTTGVPIVSDTGRQLARAFEDAVGEVVIAKLINAIIDGTLEGSSLYAIGEAIHPSNLKEGTTEMDMLREFLWRSDTSSSSVARRTSAWLLLDLSRKNVPIRDTLAIRNALYQGRTGDAMPYQPGGTQIQRWRAYQANELCHISLEALLNGMAQILNEDDFAMEPDELTNKVISKAVSPSTKNQIWEKWATQATGESHDEEALSTVICEGLRRFNERSGDPALLQSAILLLRLLWQKWRTDNDLKNEISKHAVRKHCSLAGVLDTLTEHQTASVKDAISAVLRRHVIAEHLAIAGIKLSSSGKFTYRFMLEDGTISNGLIAEYGFTNPRLTNLANFLADAKLINVDGTLTEIGTKLLDETQPA